MINIEMSGLLDFEKRVLRRIGNVSDNALKDVTEIVRHENQVNVSGARSIHGGLVKPSKKKYGVTLIDKGILLGSIKSKKLNSTSYEVYILPVRNKIAGYLQHGTNKMVARPFFGFSAIILQRINEYIRKINSKNG